MKKYSYIRSVVFFICSIFFFCVVFSRNAFAQEAISQENPKAVSAEISNLFNELELRSKMKNDGVPSPVIEKIIAERKLWNPLGKM